MALVESLITAIERADGDALVMHVGERPYVVASAGPIELSAHGLNLQAMSGMVAQLLPADAQRALTEFGAVEHELASRPEMQGDRFTVVVARGGDDVWIEIRRHRRGRAKAVVPPPVSEPAAAVTASPVSAPPVIAPPAVSDQAPVIDLPPLVDAPAPVATPPDVAATEVAAAAPDSVAGAVDASAPARAESEDAPPVMAEAEAVAPEPPAVEIPHEAAAPPAPSEPTGAGDVVAPAAAVAAEPAGVMVEDGNEEEPSRERFEPATAPAAVIPMRTLRIEVPASAPAARAVAAPSDVERLLGVASARGATSLYLTADASPFVRVDADVRVLDGEPPLSAGAIESGLLELMPEATAEALRAGDPIEWVADLPEVGRVRCATFRDHRGPGAIFQLISLRPMSAEQAGLAPEIQALATETEGLVLVASPRGNGRTTVVGALVDLINRQRPNYVITLERQVRVVHEHHTALISQREVRGTSEQQLAIARSALRESPDVLVIDDLASAEIFQVALDAAGSGVLVIASVTASSTTAAITRVIELFPPDRRRGVQALIADRLRGAVAQVLLRRIGGGRAPAREVLLATAAVASTLASGQLQELPLAIESGRKHGLVSLTDALLQLVRSGGIDLREAYRKAEDRDALVAALKSENVDSSIVERLA